MSKYKINWFDPAPTTAGGSLFEEFNQGVAAIHRTWSSSGPNRLLSCTLSSAVPNQDSASLNVECTADGRAVLQVYVASAQSPTNEEGWFNLVEDANLTVSVEDDVRTVWDGAAGPAFVAVHFAEGVLFSEKLFVSSKFALEELSRLAQDRNVASYLGRSQWKFLGMI